MKNKYIDFIQTTLDTVNCETGNNIVVVVAVAPVVLYYSCCGLSTIYNASDALVAVVVVPVDAAGIEVNAAAGAVVSVDRIVAEFDNELDPVAVDGITVNDVPVTFEHIEHNSWISEPFFANHPSDLVERNFPQKFFKIIAVSAS